MGNVDKVVWGGYYKNLHNMWNNNQSYGTSVPVKGPNGEVWMIDTHMLHSSFGGTEDVIERIVEKFPDGNHLDYARREAGGFYHNNIMEVTSNEELEQKFELIADLNEYRAFERNELASHYPEEDVLSHVRLYSEHGYSWTYGDRGVYLVKKNSMKDTELIFKEKLRQAYSDWTKPSSASQYYMSLLEEAFNNCDADTLDPRDIAKYETLKKLNTRLDEMSKEISDIISDNQYKQSWTFLDYVKTKLGDIKGMGYYLANKCYCPNEVYDCGGIFYELFYEDDPIKVIADGPRGISVICKQKSASIPELLIISVDNVDVAEEDKIIDMTRYDVTPHNVELAKGIVHKDLGKQKVDSVKSKTKPSDINDLIESLEEVELTPR